MNIGGLRHRITIQRAADTVNDTGDPVQTWATLATVWARIEPTTGKERFAAMEQQAEVDYRITCRYQSALSVLAPDDRLVRGNYRYDIKAVINTEERNRELQIFAKRHIAASASVPLTDVAGDILYFVNGDAWHTVN